MYIWRQEVSLQWCIGSKSHLSGRFGYPYWRPGDSFCMWETHGLSGRVGMYVRDVPVTQNIKCICVTDSYGLWINRSQIIVFSTNTLWQDCGYFCCNGYWRYFFPKHFTNLLTYKTLQYTNINSIVVIDLH